MQVSQGKEKPQLLTVLGAVLHYQHNVVYSAEPLGKFQEIVS